MRYIVWTGLGIETYVLQWYMWLSMADFKNKQMNLTCKESKITCLQNQFWFFRMRTNVSLNIPIYQRRIFYFHDLLQKEIYFSAW